MSVLSGMAKAAGAIGLAGVQNYMTDRLSERQNKRQEETWKRERAIEYAYAQNAERNSVRNQVIGLQQAGFNPASLGSPNAQVAGGSLAQPQGGGVQSANIASNISAVKELELLDAQKENIEANTEKTKEDTKAVGLQNKSTEDTFGAVHQAVISKLGSIQIDPDASDSVKEFASHLQLAMEDKKFAKVADVVEAVNAGVKANEMSWNEIRFRNQRTLEDLIAKSKGDARVRNPEGILGDLAYMPDYEQELLVRRASEVTATIQKMNSEVSVNNQTIENLKKQLEQLGAQINYTYTQNQNLRDSNLMNTWRGYSEGELGGLETTARLALMFLNGFGFH